MDFKQIEKLGLTKNEALVYVNLLELGSSTSGDIIRKSGLHGSKVYAALDRLKRKGLANYVIKSGKKSFIATDPRRLLELEYERETLVKQIIPELEQLHRKHRHIVKIEIYEDWEGLKNIVQVTLGCRHFDVLASEDEIFPGFSEQFSRQIAKRKINVRILAKGNVKEQISNLKILPVSFISPFSFLVLEKKVAMIVYAERPYAILIESESIYNKYKAYFEILWKISKKI